MKDKLINSDGMNIALIYPKAIGDLLFLMPALHSLRAALPDAGITLVCKNKQEPLTRGFKGRLVDRVLCLQKNNVGELRSALRNNDVLIDFAGNDQAGLLMGLMPGRRIRPCRADCRGMCFLYSLAAETLPSYDRRMHRVEQFLFWSSALVDMVPVHSFELFLPAKAQDLAEEVIDKFSLRDGRVVALNIGASRDTKCWPADRFKSLAEELVNKGLRVVIMGARRFEPDDNYDARSADGFAESGLFDGENCINLVTEGNLDIDDQLQRDAFFLRYSGVPAVTVGNDTGPMHLAGSTGDDAKNRTVSLFGPTNWRRYAPYDPSRSGPDRPAGDYNRVVTAEGCSEAPSGCTETCPKYKSGCAGKQCMTLITVDAVMKAVEESLA